MLNLEDLHLGDLAVFNEHSSTSPDFIGAIVKVVEVYDEKYVRAITPNRHEVEYGAIAQWNSELDFDNQRRVHKEVIEVSRLDPYYETSTIYDESPELDKMFTEMDGGVLS